MPRISPRVENNLTTAFWTFFALIVPSVATYIGARQQALLKRLDRAHIHLTGFDGFLVWLPSYVPLVAFAAFAALAIILIMRRSPRQLEEASSNLPTTAESERALQRAIAAMNQAAKERDSTQLEAAAAAHARNAAVSELSNSKERIAALEAEVIRLKSTTLEPYIRDYLDTTAMASRIKSFADSMAEITPSGDFTADIVKVLQRGRKSTEDFDSSVRPDLIKLVNRLKSERGIMSHVMDDKQLTMPMSGPAAMKYFIDAAYDLANLTRDALIEKIEKANA